MNALEIAKGMVARSELWTSPLNPFKAHIEDGMPHLVVVAGDNGSGKSYFVERLRAWGRGHHGLDETICISMRLRTGAGLSDISGTKRAMVFGREEVQSTGQTSVAVALRALHNMKMREESGHKCLVILDEPEIGLAGSYSRALGELIASRLRQIPCQRTSLVLVTHSRALVTGLRDVEGVTGAPPSFVFLGERPRSLASWLEGDENRTVDELLGLQARCLDHRQAVETLEGAVRAAA